MKIGIFGDSQANHNPDGIPDKSWVEILKSKNFNITNFAEPGSCLYFSYEKFIKNHEKYDKIIFCITDHARIYLPEHSTIFIQEDFPNRNAKIDTAKSIIKNKKFIFNNLKIINALNLYYQYIYNDNSALLFYNLMIEKIKKIRPDGLYFHFYNIVEKENKFYNIDNNTIKKYRDLRVCHLTQTNNYSISEYVVDWLNSKNYDIELYYKNPIEHKDKYFKEL